MSNSFKITLESDEYTLNKDGSITFKFEPCEYNLIDEDDAANYVEAMDLIDDIDADDLIDELERRNISFILGDVETYIADKMNGSAEDIRRLLADMLNISRLSTADEICNKLRQLL